MKAKHNLFGFLVEIDETCTQNWYAGAEEWDCDCGDCRSFIALAHKRHLPADMLEALDELGIPPEKATYVCMLYSDGDGQHYQCSYRIAGSILSEAADTKGAGQCCHEPYPYGAPGFPEPHFDLEFRLTLSGASDEQ